MQFAQRIAYMFWPIVLTKHLIDNLGFFLKKKTRVYKICSIISMIRFPTKI